MQLQIGLSDSPPSPTSSMTPDVPFDNADRHIPGGQSETATDVKIRPRRRLASDAEEGRSRSSSSPARVRQIIIKRHSVGLRVTKADSSHPELRRAAVFVRHSV
jgi:hypothetical protein